MALRKENPGSLGERAGVGGTPEGGRRKLNFLVRGHRNLCRQDADLLQFFVGKKPFFLVARAFQVSNSSLVRDPGKFINRQSQQDTRHELASHILVSDCPWFLPHAGINASPSCSTAKIMFL